jgi:hypothetical protein
MGEAIAVLAIGMLVMALLAATALGALVHRVRVSNEVSRTYRNHPPARWLASPSACGRLHRRLRAAVAALRLAVPARPRRRWRRSAEPTTLEVLAQELEVHAAALDRDLAIADRQRGPVAVPARRLLAEQVRSLEGLANRVVSAARTAALAPGSEPTAEALRAITDRLDALDAAHAELARLDAQSVAASSLSTMAPFWSTSRPLTDARSG